MKLISMHWILSLTALFGQFSYETKRTCRLFKIVSEVIKFRQFPIAVSLHTW
jgi:hypothetical protein